MQILYNKKGMFYHFMPPFFTGEIRGILKVFDRVEQLPALVVGVVASAEKVCGMNTNDGVKEFYKTRIDSWGFLAYYRD